MVAQPRRLEGGVLHTKVLVITPGGPVALEQHPEKEVIEEGMKTAEWKPRRNLAKHKGIFPEQEMAVVQMPGGGVLSVIRLV
jgi:hypothetical protein